MIGVASSPESILPMLPPKTRATFEPLYPKVRPSLPGRLWARLLGKLFIPKAVGEPRKAVPLPGQIAGHFLRADDPAPHVGEGGAVGVAKRVEARIGDEWREALQTLLGRRVYWSVAAGTARFPGRRVRVSAASLQHGCPIGLVARIMQSIVTTNVTGQEATGVDLVLDIFRGIAYKRLRYQRLKGEEVACPRW